MMVNHPSSRPTGAIGSKTMHLQERREISAVLALIYERSGYDFSGYNQSHVRRRLLRRMLLAGLPDLATMREKMQQDRVFLDAVFNDFSICVTEMFRDPLFFRALRYDVLPYLQTEPLLNCWVAGCATGEEAYSLAILLMEEGIYERSQIYATDINVSALQTAKEGVVEIKNIGLYTENYQEAGGKAPFVDYYSVVSGMAHFDDRLKKNILFFNHNLVTDGSLGEMHLILCRNVMIYFQHELQNRVLDVFRESLSHRGFLGLGSKESLLSLNRHSGFERWVPGENIYRKLGERSLSGG